MPQTATMPPGACALDGAVLTPRGAKQMAHGVVKGNAFPLNVNPAPAAHGAAGDPPTGPTPKETKPPAPVPSDTLSQAAREVLRNELAGNEARQAELRRQMDRLAAAANAIRLVLETA